jgi:hypothetical protein
MGLLIAKDIAPEVPPPGPGLKTVTLAEPPAATSLPEMDALNRFPFSKVVTWLTPFQRTTELGMKPDPVTERVKAAFPAMVEAGSMNPIDGTGFPIVNDTEFEAPPPGAGLTTVTVAVPALAISLAGIVAVRCVLPLPEVVRGDPFH